MKRPTSAVASATPAGRAGSAGGAGSAERLRHARCEGPGSRFGPSQPPGRAELHRMNIPTDWIRALAGGALIGTSASVLLAFNGRVAGISGIVGGLLVPTPGDVSWRALFVAGLLAGGLVAATLAPGAFTGSPAPLAIVALAGLLVGFGTRVGNGCTSGHGVCGITRSSPRSLAATMVFIATGALTVLLTRGWAQ